MTKEQILLIKVLADYINKRKTIVDDSNVNWDTLVYYAKKHQVSGIVYTQVKKIIPTRIGVDLQREMMREVYLQANRENDLDIVKTAFFECQIPFFFIKGPTVASLYPVPELRTMGDIDIVVHHRDRERCHKLLLEHGFECASKEVDREWQYYKKGMEYELHDRLVYKEAVNKDGQAEFFNDCWKYIEDDELDWSFHFLFLFFHLGKHLMNAGVGLRQFLDLSIVIQKKQIDWIWIKEKLIDINMYRFVQRCLGLIERWFGVKTPIAGVIDDVFFERSTEQILKSGVFGHYEKSVTITNTVRHEAFPHLKMFYELVKKVFPPINEIRKAKQYAYLNQTALLLPCAWVHRWVRGIKYHKFSNLLHIITNSFTSNDAVRERNSILDQWGL